MTKYKLKAKYKGCTIKPGAKEIVLEFLSDAQVELLIKAGYTDYFTEVKKAKKTKED
tara:strand:- start:1839 stop:2009 length:171 start_codon:yes stop_codon:yes gene_type:complete